MFTQSFCVRRSRKRKKTVKLPVPFCTFWDLRAQKLLVNMLVKLTPREELSPSLLLLWFFGQSHLRDGNVTPREGGENLSLSHTHTHTHTLSLFLSLSLSLSLTHPHTHTIFLSLPLTRGPTHTLTQRCQRKEFNKH